jgi:hypothetical protein
VVRIEAGIRWLLESGVQTPHGGFAAWYDAEHQNYPYVYAEITGYLVTLLCQWHARTGEARFLAAARAAGDWLGTAADKRTGGFRCLVPLRPTEFDGKQDQVYAFDTGVIVNGLANLYRASGDDRHLAAAVRAADWLVDEALRADGGLRPVWDARREEFAPEADDWSRRAGGYHAKVAAGLANLAELTGGGRYRRAAIRICEFACGLQEADGRIAGHAGGTHSHPHAYAAEGLWAAGMLLDRPAYVDASRRATEWLLTLRRDDGTVARFVRDGVPLHASRTDVQAQALRLATIHGLPDGADQMAAALRAHQAGSEGRCCADEGCCGGGEGCCGGGEGRWAGGGDRRVDGGWWFGRLSDGRPVPHVNVWATAFAVQALDLRAGAVLDPRFLV